MTMTAANRFCRRLVCLLLILTLKLSHSWVALRGTGSRHCLICQQCGGGGFTGNHGFRGTSSRLIAAQQSRGGLSIDNRPFSLTCLIIKNVATIVCYRNAYPSSSALFSSNDLPDFSNGTGVTKSESDSLQLQLQIDVLASRNSILEELLRAMGNKLRYQDVELNATQTSVLSGAEALSRSEEEVYKLQTELAKGTVMNAKISSDLSSLQRQYDELQDAFGIEQARRVITSNQLQQVTKQYDQALELIDRQRAQVRVLEAIIEKLRRSEALAIKAVGSNPEMALLQTNESSSRQLSYLRGFIENLVQSSTSTVVANLTAVLESNSNSVYGNSDLFIRRLQESLLEKDDEIRILKQRNREELYPTSSESTSISEGESTSFRILDAASQNTGQPFQTTDIEMRPALESRPIAPRLSEVQDQSKMNSSQQGTNLIGRIRQSSLVTGTGRVVKSASRAVKSLGNLVASTASGVKKDLETMFEIPVEDGK